MWIWGRPGAVGDWGVFGPPLASPLSVDSEETRALPTRHQAHTESTQEACGSQAPGSCHDDQSDFVLSSQVVCGRPSLLESCDSLEICDYKVNNNWSSQTEGVF